MAQRLSHCLIAFGLVFLLAACTDNTDKDKTAEDNPVISEPDQTDPAPQPPVVNDPPPTALLNVTLNWIPPTAYTDGSNLDDLTGHHVYMKTGSNDFVKIHSVEGTAVTTHLVTNLSPGTYTFAVTAYNSAGVESTFSTPFTITL